MPSNIFVLTGAGISAESGLCTFRDKRGEGIWAKFDPMKLATPEAFARDPETVLAFYDLRRRNLRDAKPSAAHFALARLEDALAKRGDSLALVTQTSTICTSAQARGASSTCMANFQKRCGRCEVVRPWLGDPTISDGCPNCGDAGALRPHVVWFGEMPLASDLIDRALHDADLFVAIGTSCAVYAATGFVVEARACGLRTCEIDLAAADNADLFDEQRLGPANETVPAWVEELVGGLVE